jgi:putative cell wall-binding protein
MMKKPKAILNNLGLHALQAVAMLTLAAICEQRPDYARKLCVELIGQAAHISSTNALAKAAEKIGAAANKKLKAKRKIVPLSKRTLVQLLAEAERLSKDPNSKRYKRIKAELDLREACHAKWAVTA